MLIYPSVIYTGKFLKHALVQIVSNPGLIMCHVHSRHR